MVCSVERRGRDLNPRRTQRPETVRVRRFPSVRCRLVPTATGKCLIHDLLVSWGRPAYQPIGRRSFAYLLGATDRPPKGNPYHLGPALPPVSGQCARLTPSGWTRRGCGTAWRADFPILSRIE